MEHIWKIQRLDWMILEDFSNLNDYDISSTNTETQIKTFV